MELLKKLEELNPLLIGFQVFTVEYSNFRKILPTIRKVIKDVKIIAGGPHVSALPEQTMVENPDLDFIVKGEGEEALPSLVRCLVNSSDEDFGKINNLVFRWNKQIVMNPIHYIDVKKYGAPAWEQLEPDRYPAIQHGTFHKSTHVAPILTSRGCPYPCTYCAGHLLTGKRIRRRDVGEIVDEIEYLQKKYHIEEFIIEDDNFTFYKNHVLDFANEIEKRNIRCYFSFPNGVRLDRLDEETIIALKKMGTYKVGLGIESVSKKTLKTVKKNWNLSIVQERINLLKKHNLLAYGFFILGFPDETIEDIKMTVNFAMNSKLDMAYFGNYIPLPGSDDLKRMLQTGEIKEEDIDWDSYSSNFGEIPYHPKDISREELLKALRKANMRFYLRPRILFNFIRYFMKPIFMKSLLKRVFFLFWGYKKRKTTSSFSVSNLS